MKALLDTGPLTAYLRGRQGAIARLGPLVAAGDASTTVLNYGEVVETLQSFPQTYSQYLSNLHQLLQNFVTPLLPDFASMEHYATLRRTMRTLRTPQGQTVGLIGDIDTLIAAIALVHNLTVITIDSDFTRVPGLSVQLLTGQELRLA